MEQKYCQSCGMPMDADDMFGTNADGSRNEEYCKYCFENGQFVQICTMDEMIEFCVPHVAQGSSGMNEDEAREMMNEVMPTLKRWS